MGFRRDVACAGTREKEGSAILFGCDMLGQVFDSISLYYFPYLILDYLFYFPYFVLDYLFYNCKNLRIRFRSLYFFTLD